MGQAKRKPDASPAADYVVRVLRESALYVLAALALYFFLALLGYSAEDPAWSHSGTGAPVQNLTGVFGAWFADVVFYLFGYMAYLFPVMVAYSGWLIMRESDDEGHFDRRKFALRWAGFVLLMITGCGLGSFIWVARNSLPEAELGAGGILGLVIGIQGLATIAGSVGTKILLLAVFFASITIFTGISWFKVMDWVGALTLRLIALTRHLIAHWVEQYRARQAKVQKEETYQKVVEQELAKPPRKVPRIEPVFKPAETSEREFKEKQITLFDAPPNTELPPLNLLEPAKPSKGGYSKEALEAMSRLVERKLSDFGISVEVVEVHPGPVVTRFELQPAPGVKVSQISNLSKDLARAMSIVSVRVVEVIAGKSTVGLEIPNEVREIVMLSEVIKSADYEKLGSPLALALGKDIAGKPVVADLGRMPHLLVAGTTGSGKSVGINAMLLSLLYKATPRDIRLILVDPKMLELNVYEGIPHLLSPVVTDMKDAANALRWCVAEMERRYKVMAALGVRNIAGFNRKVLDANEAGKPIPDPLYKREEAFDPSAPAPTLNNFPYIVVIIDEYADMIMVVGKKVEELIARLAQKARASGIHLILATQRPSVDVITGLIKANIPTRIAFQVSSKIDSRTILDQMGAEQLLGHGDMLYLPPGTSIPERVHGAFVDDAEVHRVVAHLKKAGKPDYIDGLLEGPSEPLLGFSGEMGGGRQGGDEKDSLYDEAVAIVTESRKGSISYVQRRLRIGYNRAARMLEEMEANGVVSNLQSNGSREVLAPPPPKN
ncbi:MAG: DNA translocase FtsK 4TM domain-containing protein [Gammaproteobacteria bacterium]|nr:DNA translocase FtsK 4TM domain-containing protein [Gammaproteobacteria bacterium]